MGTDSVGLFDKRLCDRLLAFDETSVAAFLDSKRTDFDEFSLFRFGFAPDTTGSERLEELVRQGMSMGRLKEELIHQLCLSGQRIQMDYWGCFAEVFSSENPPGSISSRALLPDTDEERFLLLQPEHVAQMLTSLYSHRGKIWVMSESDLDRLESWRERCAQDLRWMVAYFFDY